jgi:hypothetical protein
VLYLGRPDTSVIAEAYRSLVDAVEGMRPELLGPRRFVTVDVDAPTCAICGRARTGPP